MSSAYLLVSHGSRDPRPQIAVADLAQQISLALSVRSQATATTLPVPPRLATAGLELAPQPLHREIVDLVGTAAGEEIDRVVILPLFLLPGVHVMEDIPREVELAHQILGDRVELTIAPYLGSYPDLDRVLLPSRQCLPDRSILLSHGSRRTGGNAIVERLADRLAMTCAYWSVAPNLTDQVSDLARSGVEEIGILPYFLFPGATTDAIANLVTDLSKQFPTLQLTLAEPIGGNAVWVGTITEMLLSAARANGGKGEI